jgi:hypothetical protein
MKKIDSAEIPTMEPDSETSDEKIALARLQRCRLEHQTVKEAYLNVKRGVTMRHVDRAWERMIEAEREYYKLIST